MKSVFATLVLALPALAHADPVRIATAPLEGPPGADQPRIDEAVEAPPIPKYNVGVGASRGLAVGTALTVPEGKYEVSMRTFAPFAGVGLHVGITQTTELWVEAGGELSFDSDRDGLRVFGAGAKQVLARDPNWQIAATGSVRHIEIAGSDDGQLATLGGVASFCNAECTGMASVGFSLLFVEDEKPMPLLTLGVSIGTTTTRGFAEFVGAGNFDDRLSALMLGVRRGNRKVAVDVGLLRVFDAKDSILPMLSLLIRP